MSQALCIFGLDEVTAFFVFLDKLKGPASAAPGKLVSEFGLSKEKAETITAIWVKSYSPKIAVSKRARIAFMAHGGTI